MKPMRNEQLECLWGMTTDTDQRPGRDATERWEELHAGLGRILAEWESIRGGGP